MQYPRLRRFERAASPAPMELTARDRNILQLVHRHRFLRSSHLAALMADPSQQLLRRLQLLFHNGFLERPRAQLDYYHHGGSKHLVYGIGSKGANLLKQEIGLQLGSVRWGEKNRSVGRVYLDHALLVSDVMVALELGSRQNSRVHLIHQDELTALGHGSDNRGFRWHVDVKNNVKLGVIPDRVFALDYENQGSLDRAFFFLEADRATMPITRHNLSQSSFYRKLLAYEATWSQSIHRSRFGFHRFRVLTVTTSADRVHSLLEACARLRSGHGLFLFADQKILEQPSGILSATWQTGRQAETATLLG